MDARSLKVSGRSTANFRVSADARRAPPALMERINRELGIIQLAGNPFKGIAPFNMLRTPVPVWVAREFVREVPTLYRAEAPFDHTLLKRTDVGSADRLTLSRLNLDQILDHPLNRNDRNPVTNISWYEARALADWLGGRLPTSSEWGLAAGRDEEYPDENVISWETWGEKNQSPAPVCKLGDESRSNANGLSDMLGNVWEWFEDASGELAALRKIKGGSWDVGRDFARVANYGSVDPSKRSFKIGLRPVV